MTLGVTLWGQHRTPPSAPPGGDPTPTDKVGAYNELSLTFPGGAPVAGSLIVLTWGDSQGTNCVVSDLSGICSDWAQEQYRNDHANCAAGAFVGTADGAGATVTYTRTGGFRTVYSMWAFPAAATVAYSGSNGDSSPTSGSHYSYPDPGVTDARHLYGLGVGTTTGGYMQAPPPPAAPWTVFQERVAQVINTEGDFVIGMAAERHQYETSGTRNSSGVMLAIAG